MKLSQLLGKRFKEKPSDTKLKSHELLIRGGYMRPVFNGIFSLLPPGKKIVQKIENIVREEMNAIGGQEVEMPLVQPIELWEESGRCQTIQEELARLKDRTGHQMVLAMTHEESTVALARTEVGSYKDYPFMVYQFAKKFRDEARPRGGLIRVKEFTMKDAYSFHTNEEDMVAYYEDCAIAYARIFARSGIPEVIAIQSDNGIMGGKISHEYMLLADAGEDTIITCNCGYKANREVATSIIPTVCSDEAEEPLTPVETPNTKTIDELAAFLNIPATKTCKTLFYRPIDKNEKAIVVMIRGDRDVNEMKLAKILKATPALADDETIENAGSVVGFASGYGLKDCRIFVDKSVENEKNLVIGANKIDTHMTGFNLKRDMPEAVIVDVATAADGDICPCCGKKLVFNRGIEVGNIFQLGDKYSLPMKMTYLDENNTPQVPIMACYGIGIGRLMASVAEVRNDDKGPIWPVSIAPWEIEIVTLYPANSNDEAHILSEKLYNEMKIKGLDVLWDERRVSPGEKFADADLLGAPLQMVISPRNLEKGEVEVKNRATGEKTFVKVEEALAYAENFIKTEKEKLMTSAASMKAFQ
ncbi:MAG: proline--tRNA ligase [Alphaproteobacteria bacterium]|nr:proline--tRNA ligase [Alphaproteobacteria bacterium]